MEPPDTPISPANDQQRAARVIQRNYRGYKGRRELNGLSLDASTRWEEAIKEARFQHLIRPQPHREQSASTVASATTVQSSTFAQSEWRRLRQIAHRAQSDDTSDTDGEEGMTKEQLDAYKKQKAQDKRKREQHAKQMGIEYWLEMVDQKHRYGSHLRKYHALWSTADTHDNFFYWLDYGDGRSLDAPKCSRVVLDRDQVRYLSREERQNYLVTVDDKGRFRWAKNNELVNTSPLYKDSLNGIVPIDQDAPVFRQEERFGIKSSAAATTSLSSASSSDVESASDDGAHYADEDLGKAPGITHVSADAVLNHMLKTTTKKNTWIFVADTSFRLFMGIKQPGAFQHSSFLHGARIASAGQLKVKNGQLRMLAPLSGHYRPPTASFRAFVHSLRERGVDMSRVSISRSYAILLGLEGYKKSKKRAEDGVKAISSELEKILSPESARKKEEQALDRSKSAKMERDWLQRQQSAKKNHSFRTSLTRSLGLSSKGAPGVEEKPSRQTTQAGGGGAQNS